MFYSTDLLSFRGGRFSLIWKLSLEGSASKLKRSELKELLECDVGLICKDLRDLFPLSTSCLSLPLSMSLMRGSVILHERQLAHLKSTIKDSLFRSKRRKKLLLELNRNVEKSLDIVPEKTTLTVNLDFPPERENELISPPTFEYDEPEEERLKKITLPSHEIRDKNIFLEQDWPEQEEEGDFGMPKGTTPAEILTLFDNPLFPSELEGPLLTPEGPLEGAHLTPEAPLDDPLPNPYQEEERNTPPIQKNSEIRIEMASPEIPPPPPSIDEPMMTEGLKDKIDLSPDDINVTMADPLKIPEDAPGAPLRPQIPSENVFANITREHPPTPRKRPSPMPLNIEDDDEDSLAMPPPPPTANPPPAKKRRKNKNKKTAIDEITKLTDDALKANYRNDEDLVNPSLKEPVDIFIENRVSERDSLFFNLGSGTRMNSFIRSTFRRLDKERFNSKEDEEEIDVEEEMEKESDDDWMAHLRAESKLQKSSSLLRDTSRTSSIANDSRRRQSVEESVLEKTPLLSNIPEETMITDKTPEIINVPYPVMTPPMLEQDLPPPSPIPFEGENVLNVTPSIITRSSSEIGRGRQELYRNMSNLGKTEIDLEEIIPAKETSRLDAALAFSHLLHLASERKVDLNQNQQWGRVKITLIEK